MKILITGRSGSGKSTICRELRQQSFTAFDTDGVPGLARWVDAQTHQPVEVDYSQPINRTATLWYWNAYVLRELIAKHDDLFLCGSADNALEFRKLFDKVFVLGVTPETQRQRIIARTEHDYGKLPEMQDQLIKEQRLFVHEAMKAGASVVDAEPKPTVVVDKIIRRLSER